MAFNSTPPRAEYVATAGQTAFPFLFKIYEETDLVVYQETAPADPVLLLLTTDYTVTIDGDNGGEITLVSGATLDDNITILRSLPLTRDVEYQTSGDLLADTLNLDQEYQTYLIADQLDRTTALEAGDAGVSSFVQRSGDTMTGQLKGITPVDANDMTRKDYVDTEDALRLLLTGGTVTGQIKGITPIADEDLARKDYVDGIAASIAIFNDTKTAGTDGGTFTAGAWRTRDLNTSDYNSITGASLATNQITLPAGTYDVHATAIGHDVDEHKIRLQNITDASTEIIGSVAYSTSLSSGVSNSILMGTVTIAATKVFELQHYCGTSQSTDGFGKALGVLSEVYAQIRVRKIA